MWNLSSSASNDLLECLKYHYLKHIYLKSWMAALEMTKQLRFRSCSWLTVFLRFSLLFFLDNFHLLLIWHLQEEKRLQFSNWKEHCQHENKHYLGSKLENDSAFPLQMVATICEVDVNWIGQHKMSVRILWASGCRS